MNRPFPARRSLGAWASPVALLIAFVVALGLVAGSALLDTRNGRALDASNRSVARTLEALDKLRQLGNLLYYAELSERGYVLTGKDSYLEPYGELHRSLDLRLEEVGRLMTDIPEQHDHLARLRTFASRMFAELDRTIDVDHREGRQKAIDLINSDESIEAMVGARPLIQAMLDTEGRLLAERRETASRAYAHGQLVSFVSSVVIAIALCAFYLLMLRYARERDSVQRELEETNAGLERRVRERTAELSQLSRHLINVREGEKKSIARDLHDEFGSYLTAINMDVSRVRDKISAADPEHAARLERTLGLLGHAIEMKRRLISELRPSILDNLGLGAALEQYVDDWSRYTGISTTFKYSGDLDSSEEGCPIAIFRVFQEALSNVAKHSGASEVVMSIERDVDTIRFQIVDNGTGLPDDALGKPGAHGLLGIRERILAYNGQLEYLPTPSGGTTIRASVECRATAAPASVENEASAALA